MPPSYAGAKSHGQSSNFLVEVGWSKDESAKHSGNGVCLRARAPAVRGGRIYDVCANGTGNGPF